MNPTTLLRLLESPQFLTGAVFGVLAFLVGLMLRARRPFFGILFSFAAAASIGWLGLVSPSLTERALLREPWILLVVVVGAVSAIYGLTDQRQAVHPAWMTAITLGGIWATVPDTEEAAVLLGVMAGVMPVVFVARSDRLLFVGAEFLVVIASWAVVVGSLGRDGAVLGGMGALASLALLRWRRITSPWLDLTLHIVLVLVWTRVAGLRQSAAEAAALGASATVVVGAVRWLLGRRRAVAIVEHGPKPPTADEGAHQGHPDRQ